MLVELVLDSPSQLNVAANMHLRSIMVKLGSSFISELKACGS